MGMKFNLSLLSIFLVFSLVSCVQNQTNVNSSIAEFYGLKVSELSKLGDYKHIEIDHTLAPYTRNSSSELMIDRLLPPKNGSIRQLETKLTFDKYVIFFRFKDNSFISNEVWLFNNINDASQYFEALKNDSLVKNLIETKSFGEDDFSYSFGEPEVVNYLVFRKGRVINMLRTYNQNPDTWAKLVESRIK